MGASVVIVVISIALEHTTITGGVVLVVVTNTLQEEHPVCKLPMVLDRNTSKEEEQMIAPVGTTPEVRLKMHHLACLNIHTR